MTTEPIEPEEEWVIFVEARNDEHGLRMKCAWSRPGGEPTNSEKMDARAKVSGMFRHLFQEWAQPYIQVRARNEAGRARKTFN